MMAKSIEEISKELGIDVELVKSIRLRQAVLTYFDTPKPSRSCHDDPIFAQFSRDEVKIGMRAADTLGLITKVNLKDTSGAIYQTTDDGVIVRDHLKEKYKDI